MNPPNMNVKDLKFNDGSRSTMTLRRRPSRPYRVTRRVTLVATFTFMFTVYCLVYYQNNLAHTSYGRCNVLSMLDRGQIAQLEELDLKDCNLEEIPKSIQYATRLKKLDVSNNHHLSSLPDELEYCQELDILFASNCPSIKTLPSVLGKTNIQRLGWRSGSLKHLDPNGIPPNIVHLILTNNQIETIDDLEVFKKLKNVRKLLLSHNRLSSFGGADNGGVELMTSLELLRLAGNNLNIIPSQLWKLPNLTWLTISGNPVVRAFQIEKLNAATTPSITMQDLKPMGKDLGEGASGKVGLYEWQGKQVAVKIIHGVTSDGTAEDELSIYNVVGSSGVGNRAVGCLALLNDERKGVVMEPLPSEMKDLALPPTIVEVTQDRWDVDTMFSASFVKNALNDAASALFFLHSYDISHGDFYAHNMKVDRSTGHLFLLDFGASFFKGTYSSQAEQIEVRAYGIFVGEMIALLDPEEIQLIAKLRSLYQDCTNPIVSERPLFSSIKTTVREL